MRLTVTYTIPDDAPDWFFGCVEDGDRNGMVDYAVTHGLHVDSATVSGAERTIGADYVQRSWLP